MNKRVVEVEAKVRMAFVLPDHPASAMDKAARGLATQVLLAGGFTSANFEILSTEIGDGVLGDLETKEEGEPTVVESPSRVVLL